LFFSNHRPATSRLFHFQSNKNESNFWQATNVKGGVRGKGLRGESLPDYWVRKIRKSQSVYRNLSFTCTKEEVLPAKAVVLSIKTKRSAESYLFCFSAYKKRIPVINLSLKP
jgi:hypothetical protein